MSIYLSTGAVTDCETISQTTNTVLMIPPNAHSAVFDPETAADNKLMNNINVEFTVLMNEWNSVVYELEENGITGFLIAIL